MQQNMQLQPKQMGTVRFDSDPHRADIYVDGHILTDPNTEESIKTPASVLLYEGRRNYTISIEGYEDESGYVDVYPGATVNIYKRLKQGVSEEGWGEPEPQIWLQSQQMGTLKIYSYPDGADVFIDGRSVGKTPTTVSNVPAGARRVTFKMPGMMIEEKTVDIHPGAWSSIDATMRPTLPSLSYQSYQPMSSTYEVKTMQTVKSADQLKLTAGNLTVTTSPSGANIHIDGKLAKDAGGNPVLTPARLVLDVGYIYIVIEKEGYFEDYNRIYIHSGENDSINRNLSKLPYASVPPESKMRSYIRSYFMSDQIRSMQGPTTGNVVITTYPVGATINMDGNTVIDIDTKELLKTPVELEVGMGLHNFIFKLPGYCDEFYTIYATSRSTQYIHRNFNIC